MDIREKVFVYLDDLRNPEWHYKQSEYWEYQRLTVRSYFAFTQIIELCYQHRGFIPQIISFDYQLDAFKQDPTGADCAKWLVEFCEKHRLDLPQCLIHSGSPTGIQEIGLALYEEKPVDRAAERKVIGESF